MTSKYDVVAKVVELNKYRSHDKPIIGTFLTEYFSTHFNIY